MPKFYCLHEMDPWFSTDCVEVEARSPGAAAEVYAGSLFDMSEYDVDSPIEVFVAEARNDTIVRRFEVKRTIVVEDSATDRGDVDVPPPEEDEDD